MFFFKIPGHVRFTRIEYNKLVKGFRNEIVLHRAQKKTFFLKLTSISIK